MLVIVLVSCDKLGSRAANWKHKHVWLCFHRIYSIFNNLFSILFNKLFYHLFLICSLSSFPSWKTLTLIPTKTEQVPLLFKVHAPALSGSLIIPDTNPGVFTNHQNTRYHTKEFEGIRFKIYQIYCIKIFNLYIFGPFRAKTINLGLYKVIVQTKKFSNRFLLKSKKLKTFNRNATIINQYDTIFMSK